MTESFTATIPLRDRYIGECLTYKGKLPSCRHRHNARCVKRGMRISDGHGAKPETCRSLLARSYCPKGKG